MTCLKDRGAEGENMFPCAESLFKCLQQPGLAKPMPGGRNREFRSLTWEAGSLSLGPSPLPLRVCVREKLELRAGAGFQVQIL